MTEPSGGGRRATGVRRAQVRARRRVDRTSRRQHMQLRRWRAGGLEVRKYPAAVDDARIRAEARHGGQVRGRAKASFFTISYYARGTRGEGALC